MATPLPRRFKRFEPLGVLVNRGEDMRTKLGIEQLLRDLEGLEGKRQLERRQIEETKINWSDILRPTPPAQQFPSTFPSGPPGGPLTGPAGQ